jgi:DNA replication protein DnaC
VLAAGAGVIFLLWAIFLNKSVVAWRQERRERRKHNQLEELAIALGTATPDATTNLAAEGSLLGRKLEVAECVDHLLTKGSAPLLLKGPAGMGKSTLAQSIGHQIFSNNNLNYCAFFISAKAADISVAQLCEGLGRFFQYPALANEPTVEEKIDTAYRLLAQRATLIILDNIESISDPAVLDFAFGVPSPTLLLLTSREALPIDRPVRVAPSVPRGSRLR